MSEHSERPKGASQSSNLLFRPSTQLLCSPDTAHCSLLTYFHGAYCHVHVYSALLYLLVLCVTLPLLLLSVTCFHGVVLSQLCSALHSAPVLHYVLVYAIVCLDVSTDVPCVPVRSTPLHYAELGAFIL